MRRVVLFLMMGLVLPLVVAASASAQGSVLELNPKAVSPGGSVQASSLSGYATGAGASDVTIRLSTRSGRVLRSTAPDTRGGISTTVPIPPDLTPGSYLVLATQTTANGRQRAFTPGRAKLLVQPAPAGAGSGPGGPGGPGLPLALPAALLALVLLAAGGALVARRLRTSNRLAADATRSSRWTTS